jgi:subtilisin family serine protease
MNGILQKLDSKLAFQLAANAESGDPDERVSVLVHVVGDLATVEAAGLWTDWTVGPISRGTVAFRDLPALAALDDVKVIQVQRAGRPHIHDSVPEIHGDTARQIPPGFSGKNVIVGIVDTGVDIFHHAFRKPDGTTRIVSLFDQSMRHKFTITGEPAAGTFTLKFIGLPPSPGATRPTEVTAPINLPVTAAQFQATLEALNGIDPGDVSVTGGPLPATPIVVDFVGRYDPRVADSSFLGFDVNSGTLTPKPGGPTPKFSYTTGRNFTPDEINAALASNDEGFPSKDKPGHGTHCLGIAAGDGSQSGTADGECCHRAGFYVGVAPEADLAVVRTTIFNDDWARGAQHILEQAWRPAGTPVKPAVVSMSIGTPVSSHDGTDVAEVALDALIAAAPGRAVVVSAGNEGEIYDDQHPERHPQTGGGTHAAKTVPARGAQTFKFIIQDRDTTPDVFELWYAGNGRLTINLTVPTTPGQAPVSLPTPVGVSGGVQSFTLAGHPLQFLSTVNNAQNAKHRIVFSIAPPPGGPIANGIWTITLAETAGTATAVDCWIQPQTDDPHPRFVTADQVRQNTVETPGNARNVITVGAYALSDGQLSEFSGRGGPVVNGRPKPDLAAPGVGIVAAKAFARGSCWKCDCCTDFYAAESGTSSAAPHVAGTVALMFEANPSLTFNDVWTNLTTTCRKPSPDPGEPNSDWGFGKVDAEQAVRKSLPAHAALAAEPVTVPVAARADTYLPLTQQLDTLRRGVAASPTGRLLMALVFEHVDEARQLVNTDRRSLIAWHRMHGPGLLRSLTGSFASEVPLPAEHDGQPIADGLGRLLDALADAGSPALRDAIQDHRNLLLAVPGASLADLDALEAR